MKYRLFYSILAGLLFLFFVGGCSSSPYKTFALRRGVGYFSFEYSSHYDILKVEIRPELGYTGIVLLRRSVEGQEQDFSMITIAVKTPHESEPNVPVAVKNYLTQVSSWPNFRLLSPPSTIVITTDNISAQQFTFSNSRATRPDNIISEVRWAVLFERGGLIWEMTHQSDAATADTDKADFEYILKTFKILK